ncbi:MAG: hypothetical protein V1929_07235 [bacterium]
MPSAKGGFTLVEIALALLVAGLGVIAVFGLFPQGMDASRKSVEATEVTAFAEFIFDGLQNEATDFPWATFANGSLQFNLTHVIIAAGSTQKVIIAQGPTTPGFNVWIPFWYGDQDNQYLTNYPVAAFTYTLDIGVAGVMTRYARLEVWPGDKVGPISQYNLALSNFPGSTVFYREFLPAY